MNWIYAHLIGDYLIQNDWMALNKKQSSKHCFAHIVAYMLPFILCGLLWWQLLAIAVQHFIQDRTNIVVWFLKVRGSKKFAEPPMAPWSIVVVDNILHILWMALVVWSKKYITI